MPLWPLALIVPVLLALMAVGRWSRARKRRRRDARLRNRAGVSDAAIAAGLTVETMVSEESVGVVRRALARATGINDPSVILPSDGLALLGPFGFDDFGQVEFVMEVESWLGVRLPNKEWSKARMVADVILIAARAPGLVERRR